MGAGEIDGRSIRRRRPADELFDVVQRARCCPNPVHIVDQVTDRSIGEIRSSVLVVARKDRSEIRSPACTGTSHLLEAVPGFFANEGLDLGSPKAFRLTEAFFEMDEVLRREMKDLREHAPNGHRGGLT